MSIERRIASFRLRPHVWNRLKRAAKAVGMSTERYAEHVVVNAEGSPTDKRVHMRECLKCQTESADRAIRVFKESYNGPKSKASDPRQFFRESYRSQGK